MYGLGEAVAGGEGASPKAGLAGVALLRGLYSLDLLLRQLERGGERRKECLVLILELEVSAAAAAKIDGDVVVTRWGSCSTLLS